MFYPFANRISFVHCCAVSILHRPIDCPFISTAYFSVIVYFFFGIMLTPYRTSNYHENTNNSEDYSTGISENKYWHDIKMCFSNILQFVWFQNLTDVINGWESIPNVRFSKNNYQTKRSFSLWPMMIHDFRWADKWKLQHEARCSLTRLNNFNYY